MAVSFLYPAFVRILSLLQLRRRDTDERAFEIIMLRLLAQAEGSGASAFVVTETGVAPVGGAPAQQTTDFADALSKLADLRDRGLLTPAEFDAQKQKLLGA